MSEREEILDNIRAAIFDDNAGSLDYYHRLDDEFGEYDESNMFDSDGTFKKSYTDLGDLLCSVEHCVAFAVFHRLRESGYTITRTAATAPSAEEAHT